MILGFGFSKEFKELCRQIKANINNFSYTRNKEHRRAAVFNCNDIVIPLGNGKQFKCTVIDDGTRNGDIKSITYVGIEFEFNAFTVEEYRKLKSIIKDHVIEKIYYDKKKNYEKEREEFFS